MSLEPFSAFQHQLVEILRNLNNGVDYHGVSGQHIHQAQAVPQNAVAVPLQGASRNVPGALVFRKPGQQTLALCQNAKKTRRARRGKGLEHFPAHPFGRQGRQRIRRDGAHLHKGLAVNAPGWPARGKPRQAKNSGGVVCQRRGGSGAQQPAAQVFNRLGVHVQAACAVQRQGVDGEIPGLKIRCQRSTAQGHAFTPAPQANRNAFSNTEGIRVRGEKGIHASVKGKIQLRGATPQQKIAHSAAYEVKFHASALSQPAR